MSADAPPQGVPLPGTVRPRRVIVHPTPMQEHVPLVHSHDDNHDFLHRELTELESRNQNRYCSLVTTVIILNLLVIGGIVAGFIILGLQTRDIRNDVSDIKHLLDGSSDSEIDDDSIKLLYKKLHAIFEEVWDTNRCAKEIKKQLVDVKNDTDSILNCTEQLKDEFGLVKNDTTDILNCTEQLKENVAVVNSRTVLIRQEVEDVSSCTEQIKEDLNNFPPRPLPISRVLCDPLQDIELPQDVNKLISTNLTNTEMFATTSVGYNPNSGAIIIRTPFINTTEVAVVQLQVRVLIRQIEEDSTFSLILSTSANCNFGDCADGFYSTTRRFDMEQPEFSESGLWMQLSTKLPVQTEQRYFVFLRSNTGSGKIFGDDTDDSTACAALYISIEPVAPLFLLPS